MYKKNLHIHFAGIGGVGMSGLAKILIQRGYTVSGCDAQIKQRSIYELQQVGCSVIAGNNQQSCFEQVDLLVFSSELGWHHPEIVYAQAHNITVVHRAQMLAELMRPFYSIGITGSHGKTTTTALLCTLFRDALYDPSFSIGGYLTDQQINAHHGTGTIFIAEVDESDRSFFSIKPTCTLITNVDLDHVDTYSDLHDIQRAFKQFVSTLPFYGTLFLCADDASSAYLEQAAVKSVLFGIHERAHIRATDITLHTNQAHFNLVIHNQSAGEVILNMTGLHNVKNCLGAIAVAHEFGIGLDIIKKSLQSFAGIERRFTHRGIYRDASIIDDYGHHPEEIKQNLAIAELQKKPIILVFQPHRYSRTKAFWHEFITVFLNANLKYLIITDVYGAREQPIEQISGEHLVHDIKKHCPSFGVSYVPFSLDLHHIKNILDTILCPDDLVILQGAGNLSTCYLQNLES